MPINGRLGTFSYDDVRARGAGHHPVIVTGTFAADQGTLPLGLILAREADGDYAEYDPEGTAPLDTPVAVLDEDLDTTKATSGLVIIHGSVLLQHLKVGITAQAAPDATDLAALRTATIYPE
jgi:hypothetical protein